MMRNRMFLVSVFAVACLLSSAWAGEYVSPEGFKISYPEDWKAASKEQLDKVAAATKAATGVDQHIVTFIYGPPSENFAPNINVIPAKHSIAMDAAAEKELVKGTKAELAALGGTVPEVKSTQIQVDGHKLISLAYERTDAASKKTLRTWTVIIPGKNGSFIMTCVALKSQWGEAGPAFKSVINGLKFDGVPAN